MMQSVLLTNSEISCLKGKNKFHQDLKEKFDSLSNKKSKYFNNQNYRHYFKMVYLMLPNTPTKLLHIVTLQFHHINKELLRTDLHLESLAQDLITQPFPCQGWQYIIYFHFLSITIQCYTQRKMTYYQKPSSSPTALFIIYIFQK